jgi:hypothetical protein
MTDLITQVARTLNDVRSVGQARAALRAALRWIEIGIDASAGLSPFAVPTPDQARTNLAILRGAISGELGAIQSMDDTGSVDPANWARARRQIERVYAEVYAIEGVLGSLGNVDLWGILGDAIRGAPRIVGTAIGEVADAAGDTAGRLGGGILGGLGVPGLLLLALVLILVIGRQAV